MEHIVIITDGNHFNCPKKLNKKTGKMENPLFTHMNKILSKFLWNSKNMECSFHYLYHEDYDVCQNMITLHINTLVEEKVEEKIYPPQKYESFSDSTINYISELLKEVSDREDRIYFFCPIEVMHTKSDNPSELGENLFELVRYKKNAFLVFFEPSYTMTPAYLSNTDYEKLIENKMLNQDKKCFVHDDYWRISKYSSVSEAYFEKSMYNFVDCIENEKLKIHFEEAKDCEPTIILKK